MLKENTVILGVPKYGNIISYSPSKFVRKFKADRLSYHIEKAVRNLDNKITLHKSHPRYQEMVDGIRGIIQKLGNELPKINPIFENVTVMETGSLFTEVKVGLPYEADFLLQVDCPPNEEEFRTCRNFIFSVLERNDFLVGRNQWNIEDVKKNKVGLTVAFLWKPHPKAAESEWLAFSIDVVPIYRPAIEEVKNIDICAKAKAYLESKGLLKEFNTDLICLSTDKRDTRYDTCLIVNKIIRGLDEDVKLGYRVAKYLLQNGVIWNWVPHCEDDKSGLKLSGYDPIVKSFHLRLCFLHLLFAVHGTELANELTGATLTFCLLNMLQKCLKTQIESEIAIYISDPIIDSQRFPQQNSKGFKVNFPNIILNALHTVSDHISSVVEKFKSDALSGDLSNYGLLNYPEYVSHKSTVLANILRSYYRESGVF